MRPSELPTLENSCDTCHIKKRKCDRLIPKCTTCSNLGEPCTRIRVFNTRRPKLQQAILNHTQVFSSKPKPRSKCNSQKPSKTITRRASHPTSVVNIHEFETSQNSSTDSFTMEHPPSSYSDNLSKIMTPCPYSDNTANLIVPYEKTEKLEVKLATSIDELDSEYFSIDKRVEFFQVIKAVESRNWTRYLMNVVFLLPFSSEQKGSSFNMFLGVVQQFGNSTSPPTRPKIFQPIKFSTIPKALLNESLEAYMDRVNPYMPLFTKEGFYSQKRSEVLTAVLQASGVRFLSKQSPHNDHHKILQRRAMLLIRRDYCKPSLGVLQALLAIHFSFPGGDSDPDGGLSLTLTTVQCIALTMALQLGLHLPPAKKLHLSPEMINERQLTYNAVLFVSHAHAWRMNVPSNPPSSFLSFHSSLNTHPKLKFNPRTPISSQSLIQIMSDSLSLEVWSFTKLQLLRYLIQNYRMNSRNLLTAIRDHLSQLRTGYSKLTSKLIPSNNKPFTDNKLQVEIRKHLGYLAILYHSHIRAINCLVLHIHEDPVIPPSATPLQPRPSLELTLAIDSCARAVELAMALCPSGSNNNSLPLTRIIPLTGLSLAFLARHLCYHANPYIHARTLSKGYRWLYSHVDATNYDSFELPTPTRGTTWAYSHLKLVHHLILTLATDHPEFQSYFGFKPWPI